MTKVINGLEKAVLFETTATLGVTSEKQTRGSDPKPPAQDL